MTFSDYLGRWLPPLRPDRVQRDFERQFKKDALGHRVQTWVACFWCIACFWPSSGLELAQVPVIFYSLLRLTHTHRMVNSMVLQPVMLLVAMFAAWGALTLLWSRDVNQGLDELSVFRWFWCACLMWQVMDQRDRLVRAMSIGVLLGIAVQLWQITGIDVGISWMQFHRAPGRYSGWWDPAIGGSILVGALGLHLPAALMGVGKTRWWGAGGSVAVMLGLVATGTRGAWIAAVALIGCTLAFAVWRGVKMRRAQAAESASSTGDAGLVSPAPRRSWTGLAVAAVLVGGVAVSCFFVPAVRDRIDEARRELFGASRGRYASFVGGRLLMAREGAVAFATHPIGGVGLGGFKAWVEDDIASREVKSKEDREGLIHAHAHNMFLHIAATMGVVGLGLAGLITGLALRGAADKRYLPTWASWGTYSAGPFFAMVGLLLVSQFDTLHVNAQTAALMATLMGLCMFNPPRAVSLREADRA